MYLSFLLLFLLHGDGFGVTSQEIIPAPQTSCFNGGFLVDGSCNCPNFWTGANCDEIQCINGGYPTVYNNLTKVSPQRCTCPPGYFGLHCDAVTLIQPPTGAFSTFPMPEKTFNLVYINMFSNYWGGQIFTQFQQAVGRHLSANPQPQYDSFQVLYTTTVPEKDETDNVGNYTFKDNVANSSTLTNLVEKYMPDKYFACYTVPMYQKIIDFIKKYSLREAAITILSQHPPSEEASTELVAMALAFQIRINVVWSDDSTFIRCKAPDVAAFRELSRVTGGLFVTVPNMVTNDVTIIDSVLSTHQTYQPVAYSVGTSISCDITFQADPVPLKKYQLVTSGASSVVPGACTFDDSPNVTSSADDVSVYSFNAAIYPCTFSITAKNSNTGCSAKVFTNDISHSAYRLFTSYVEDPSIDTSNTQPDGGNPLYLALHLEAMNAEVNSAAIKSATVMDGNSPQGLTTLARSSTFDVLSNSPFICDASMPTWWINVEISEGPSVVNRFIPFKCFARSANFPTPETMAPTTEAPSTSTTWESTTPESSTTSASPTPEAEITTTTLAPCPAPTFTPPTLVLIYPDSKDSVSVSQYETYILSSMNVAAPQFNNYGEVLNEVATTLMYSSQTNFTDFYHNIYKFHAPGANPSSPAGDASQILDALKAVLNPTAPTKNTGQNSFVSVLLNKLPSGDSVLPDYSDYYQLVNNNDRVIFLMDSSVLQSQSLPTYIPARTTAPMNTIAAMTGGHFIVSDHSDTTTFNNTLNFLYTQSAAQNLILSKNQYDSSWNSIGNIDLEPDSDSINVSVTLTFAVSATTNLSTIKPLLQMKFIQQEEQPIAIGPFTLNRTPGSNFFYSTVCLAPGRYSVFSLVAGLPDTAHIRVWTARPEADVQIAFKDLEDQTLIMPDPINGAALNVTLYGATTDKLTITITDCAGSVQLYDWSQTADNIAPTASTDPPGYCQALAQFVPFFCTNTKKNGCVPGTDNVYQVQIKSSSNYYYSSKSFVCGESTETVKQGCDPDSLGNYVCGGVTVPYTRGPSGKLIDCSNNGQLVYDTSVDSAYAPYSCKCNGNAQGLSCERGVCAQPNTNGGTLDTMYRTYSVVVGVDNNSGGAGFIFEMLAAFLNVGPFDNIWQYQLIILCSSGEVVPVYIGADQTQFSAAFATKWDPSPCSVTDVAYNLSTAYTAAAAALGKQQRGVIVFHASAPNLMQVDLERFVEVSQQYKQEFYVVGLMTEALDVGQLADIPRAVYSTGGSIVLPAFDDMFDDNVKAQFKTFFNDLLNGTSTSLNFYRADVVKNEELSFTVEHGAGAYVIASGWGTQTLLRLGNLQCNDLYPGQYTRICKVFAETNTVIVQDDTPLFVTVIVLSGGVTPVATIVADRGSDDTNTAVAVSYTVSGPSLAVHVPSGYEIVGNENPNAREAKREICTFDATTYSLFKPMSPGNNYIVLDFESTNTPGTKFSKVFPIGASAAISCMNGGTPSTTEGKCICPPNFAGPDCSMPECGDGLLSTWGATCNCRGAQEGGRTCHTDLSMNY